MIAAGYAAAGDGQSAQRYSAEAEAAIRGLADPLTPPAPPQPPSDHGDHYRDDYGPDEEPLLTRARHLLHEVASGAVAGPALMEAAGRCLQQLELGYAADMIRGMYIAPAPDGPAAPEAATARRALEILGEASRVRRRGDEDWTHCQELITWAGKLALGRLKPTPAMPDEVWDRHEVENGGWSRLERHRAVHVDEICGEHCRGLSAQELPPRRVCAPLRCGRDLQRLQDPADRSRAYPVAELEQLALDPLVPPVVVLGRHREGTATCARVRAQELAGERPGPDDHPGLPDNRRRLPRHPADAGRMSPPRGSPLCVRTLAKSTI